MLILLMKIISGLRNRHWMKIITEPASNSQMILRTFRINYVRDTASYIGSICFFSFQLNWIYQTFIVFLLCAKGCGYKNEWDVVCALISSRSSKLWSLSFSLACFTAIFYPPPFLEGVLFLSYTTRGFSSIYSGETPQLCSSVVFLIFRAIVALQGWTYASEFENEASCHCERTGATHLVNMDLSGKRNS